MLQSSQSTIRIAGIDIPAQKKIEYSLQYIYGIGSTLSKSILKTAKVDLTKRSKDLTETEISRIRSELESGKFNIEGELRQKVFQDIKRLKDIRSYAGIRHKLGLPVRGQRTKSNAHTRKGKHIAVGGLNRKIEKK